MINFCASAEVIFNTGFALIAAINVAAEAGTGISSMLSFFATSAIARYISFVSDFVPNISAIKSVYNA